MGRGCACVGMQMCDICGSVGNKKRYELEQVLDIANQRGERIKELEKQNGYYASEYEKVKEENKDLKHKIYQGFLYNEWRVENMKEIKVCQGCEERKFKTIPNNMFIKTVLSEDCENCKAESKDRFEKIIHEDKYGYEDSWVLWYKVEGMDKSIQQTNLTKEECEIIYGNMNNITYWHMEVMK